VGRASSQKKVARAATTGGGARIGNNQSYGWYAFLAVIVLLGVFLVAFSRSQELNKGQAAASPKSTAPLLNTDNWHSSFNVYVCDHWAPVVPLFESRDGIDTVGDGVIEIRPYTPAASGTNATLGFFVKAASDIGDGTFKLSSSELQYLKIPGDTNRLDSEDWHNGDKCPNGSAGKVVYTVDGKTQKGNPSSWRLRDGDYLNVGFVTGGSIPANPYQASELQDTPTSGASSATTATPTTAAPATTTPPTTAAPATSTPPTTAAPATTSPPTTADK
jgi:hypothetical protein